MSYINEAVLIFLPRSPRNRNFNGQKEEGRFFLQLSLRGREGIVSLATDDLRVAAHDSVRKNAIRLKIKRVDVLRQVILSAAENSDEAQAIGNNGHGDVYILRFPLATQRGQARVLTVWIIRDGEDFPRLVTCYIL